MENAAATTADDTNERRREEIKGEHDEEKVAEPPEQVSAFVTAVFEDASKDTCNQADLCSMEEIIFRKTYSKENIANLEYGQSYTRGNGNRFKHTLDLKM